MNYDQFKNLSCSEEFEMQCTLAGISKIDALKEIGHVIDNYYFFVSMDGIFNWFDLEGNHINDPHVLKVLEKKHIPRNITKCIIPDSVTYISNNAFFHCSFLTSITIPDSVIYICDDAFTYCDSLTSITIPNRVINIGDEAFWGCKSLTSITIPNNVTRIGYNAFYRCESLKEIIFKGKTLEEVKQMQSYPFGIEDESLFEVKLK